MKSDSISYLVDIYTRLMVQSVSRKEEGISPFKSIQFWLIVSSQFYIHFRLKYHISSFNLLYFTRVKKFSCDFFVHFSISCFFGLFVSDYLLLYLVILRSFIFFFLIIKLISFVYQFSFLRFIFFHFIYHYCSFISFSVMMLLLIIHWKAENVALIRFCVFKT